MLLHRSRPCSKPPIKAESGGGIKYAIYHTAPFTTASSCLPFVLKESNTSLISLSDDSYTFHLTGGYHYLATYTITAHDPASPAIIPLLDHEIISDCSQAGYAAANTAAENTITTVNTLFLPIHKDSCLQFTARAASSAWEFLVSINILILSSLQHD